MALALLAAVADLRGDPRLGPAVLVSHGLHASPRHRGHGGLHEGRPRGHRGRPTARPQPDAIRIRTGSPSRWCNLRAKLRNTLVELTAAPTLDKLDPKIWKAVPDRAGRRRKAPVGDKQQEEQFREFRAAFTPQERLDRVEQALAEALRPLREARPAGQAESGKARPGKPSRKSSIYPGGPARGSRSSPVSDVLIGDGTAIRDSLRRPAGTVGRGRPLVRLAPAAAEGAETHAHRRRPADQGGHGPGRRRPSPRCCVNYSVGQHVGQGRPAVGACATRFAAARNIRRPWPSGPSTSADARFAGRDGPDLRRPSCCAASTCGITSAAR